MKGHVVLAVPLYLKFELSQYPQINTYSRLENSITDVNDFCLTHEMSFKVTDLLFGGVTVVCWARFQSQVNTLGLVSYSDPQWYLCVLSYVCPMLVTSAPLSHFVRLPKYIQPRVYKRGH